MADNISGIPNSNPYGQPYSRKRCSSLDAAARYKEAPPGYSISEEKGVFSKSAVNDTFAQGFNSRRSSDASQVNHAQISGLDSAARDAIAMQKFLDGFKQAHVRAKKLSEKFENATWLERYLEQSYLSNAEINDIRGKVRTAREISDFGIKSLKASFVFPDQLLKNLKSIRKNIRVLLSAIDIDLAQNPVSEHKKLTRYARSLGIAGNVIAGTLAIAGAGAMLGLCISVLTGAVSWLISEWATSSTEAARHRIEDIQLIKDEVFPLSLNKDLEEIINHMQGTTIAKLFDQKFDNLTYEFIALKEANERKGQILDELMGIIKNNRSDIPVVSQKI